MKIIINRDGDGYLAEVEGFDNLYAYGNTELEAKKELLGVVEMVMDYHLELVEKDRAIRNIILNNNIDKHALHV